MKTFQEFVENIEAMQVVAKNWADVKEFQNAVKTFLTRDKKRLNSVIDLEMALRDVLEAARNSSFSVSNFGTSYSDGKWHPMMVGSELERQKSIAAARHNDAIEQVTHALEEMGYTGSYMKELKSKMIG